MRLAPMVPQSWTFRLFPVPNSFAQPHPINPLKICQLPSVEGTVAAPCLSTTGLRNRKDEWSQATG